MTDRFDAELHDRLDRLTSAVPVESTDVLATARRTSPIGRTTWRSPVGLSAAPLLAVAVLVIVGAGLISLGRPGGPASSDGGGAGPVSATATDGPFELTIRADHGRYAATDPISLEASLVYTGPDPEIQISHGYGGPTAFGVVEPVYGIEMSAGWLSSCNSSTLKPGIALTTPFGKSGDVANDDPQADFKKQFLTDPILRLPPGTWHIYALSAFSIGGCTPDQQHQIRAEITIEVVGPEATTPATSAPSPFPTLEPELVASNTDSDGMFELTLSATKARYAPGDAIEIGASLVYTGSAATIEIAHPAGAGRGPLGFGVEEPVVGRLQLTPGWDSVCEHTTLESSMPLVVPFEKSASWSSDDPRESEYRAFMADGQLTLPVGIWHIYADSWFSIGDCSAEEHRLHTEITIAVGAPGTAPSQSADGSAFPAVCASLGFPENACAGFASWAVGQAGIEPGHVERIEMATANCPGSAACPSGAMAGYLVTLRVTPTLGDVITEVLDCSVDPSRLGPVGGPCNVVMPVTTGGLAQYTGVRSPIGGYHDVPCAGPAPENPCATPLPTIEPSAQAAAEPLSIASLEIPIDHAGAYSVVLGQASLPNGILSQATAEVTSSPTDPLVADSGFSLTIESLDGGPPFENYYAHGWRPGVEHVRVTLKFSVLMFEPGAAVVVEGVDVH